MSDDQPASHAWWRRRPVVPAACGVLAGALLTAAVLAPLPFSVTYPGLTADVQGVSGGRPVISISGTPVRDPDGALLMTTVTATAPDAEVRLAEVIGGYFASDEAVMPRDSVYPVGDSTAEIREYNTSQMRESQQTAVTAALDHLALDGEDVSVELHLADVGGPSAGLLFALGIVNLIDGDGSGGDLTGGRVIAGTGTIAPDGTVGPVGGVPLKTRAASRDGASVFLVPPGECADATADVPEGLRIVPVATLEQALEALRALESGGQVPAC